MKPKERFNGVLQIAGMAAKGVNGRSRVLFKDVLTDAEWEMQPGDFDRLVKEAEWSGPLLVDGLWEVKSDPMQSRPWNVPKGGWDSKLIKPVFNRRAG